jgi:serine-type D-Ala-D-Ala carboxypeptidase (penicillin-binding protein 5/6)
LIAAAGFLASVGMAAFATTPARAMESIAEHAILLDMNTGSVLFEKAAEEPMHPASMSKLMTLFVLFEHLREGSLSLDDSLTVSENAWRKGGTSSGSSTMFLDPGSRVRIEDLIRGITVQSGNDACIVVAEGLAGSEEAYAAEMTRRAADLGLTGSTFRNATGWPDDNHLMTARDLARIAQLTIQNHPQYYHYYSERTFTYNGIRQGNRNPLLYRNIGADGLKTGHTNASGYGLTGSAVRDNRRLILVLNGLPSVKARSQESERLIEWGFREFNNYAMFRAGDAVADAEMWLGTEETIPLLIERDLIVTLPRKSRNDMKVFVRYDGPIPAPLKAGTPVATLVITAPNTDPIEIPLLAGADVEQLGLIGRLGAALKAVLWGLTA